MDDLLTPVGMTERVPGTTPEYWAQLRFKAQGPKYMKLSARKVLYNWADVEAWLRSTERTGTSRMSA